MKNTYYKFINKRINLKKKFIYRLIFKLYKTKNYILCNLLSPCEGLRCESPCRMSVNLSHQRKYPFLTQNIKCKQSL